MTSLDNSSHRVVKVYLRNQQKMAKIVLFPSVIQTNELYQTASQSFNIPANDIHLFYGGKKVETGTSITLSDNTIIHMVNLPQLKLDELALIVKMIEGNGNTFTVKTNANTNIKDFIDNKLSTVVGLKSDKIFLVHMGRQLCLQKTFKEEEVQTECELLCLKFQIEVSADSNPVSQNQEKEDFNYSVSISIEQAPKTQQIHKTSKDIYPVPHFMIQVPENSEVNSTFNHLNLIFDATVHRSSSIRGINFEPEEIIAQEEDLSLVEMQSYKSEMNQKQPQISNIFSYNENKNESSIDYPSSKKKNSALQPRQKLKDAKGEIFIVDDDQYGNPDEKQQVSDQSKAERKVSQQDKPIEESKEI